MKKLSSEEKILSISIDHPCHFRFPLLVHSFVTIQLILKNVAGVRGKQSRGSPYPVPTVVPRLKRYRRTKSRILSFSLLVHIFLCTIFFLAPRYGIFLLALFTPIVRLFPVCPSARKVHSDGSRTTFHGA